MLIILGIFIVIMVIIVKSLKTVFGFMKEAAGVIYDELNDPDYFKED